MYHIVHYTIGYSKISMILQYALKFEVTVSYHIPRRTEKV